MQEHIQKELTELEEQDAIYWAEYADRPVIAVALSLAIAETRQSIKRVEHAIETAENTPEGFIRVMEQTDREMKHLTNWATMVAKGPQPVGGLTAYAFIDGVAIIHRIGCTYLDN